MKKILLVITIIGCIVAGILFIIFGEKNTGKIVENKPFMLKDTIIKENTLLYDIEATYPKMGVASFDEAISHLVDTHIATFKANIDTGFTDKTLKNTLGISYEMYGTGQKIMSIKMLVYDFAGGPHPNTSYDTLTFDTAHKKILQFTDIFKDEPETLKVLYSLVKPILVKNILTGLEQDTLDESTLWLDQGAGDKNKDNYSRFIIDGGNITFIFPTYQVGPYPLGTQEAVITLASLKEKGIIIKNF